MSELLSERSGHRTFALFTTPIYQQILMLITILINKQLADNEDENEIRRHWSFSLLKSVRYKSGSRPDSCIYINCGGQPRTGGCIFVVEKKKALRHQKCITHRAKVNDSKQYQRKNPLFFKKKSNHSLLKKY